MSGFPFVDEFERLIAAFEQRGHVVHRLGPGLAVTLCPMCLRNGRHSLLEIKRVPDGVDVGGCGDGWWAA